MSAIAPREERLAFTIREFCAAVGIGPTLFYSLPLEERPPVLCIGRRRLITADDARTWLAERSRVGGSPRPSAPLPPPPC